MRKLKKALSVLLAVAMMLSLCVTGFATSYTDYDEDSAESSDSYLAVDILTQLGYVEGFEDGTFRADGDYTREQAAKIITYVIAGTASGDNIGATTVTTSFTDANDRWSTPYIAYAEAAGIIAGYGDGTYGPEDTLTEAQWIKMLLVAVCGEDPDQFLGDGWETVAIDIATETFMIDTIYDEDAFDRELVCELTVDALIHAKLLTYEIVEDEDTGLPSQVVYSFTDGREETAVYDIETVALSAIPEDADVAVYYNGEYVGDEVADAVTDENGLITYAYVIDDIFGEDTYYLVYQASTQYKLTDDGEVILYNIYETLGQATGVIGTVTAISGTYPEDDYIVTVDEAATYSLSENYNSDGNSAELSVGEDYIFYLDGDGNVIYVAEYEAPVETVDPVETGYVYVYSAAVYSSVEGIKGESAYDYTYEYDFQISLEVLIVPEETGTASIEIIDLALVEEAGVYYVYDAYGKLAVLTDAYVDLVETIINDYNAAIDSTDGSDSDDCINLCGVEFAVTGGSITVDVGSFYTYYYVDDEIALVDPVFGGYIGITGSTALTVIDDGNGYDATSSAEYTIITFNYYNDEFTGITVYVGGITEDILGTYGYGFYELTPNGYVENTVLITAVYEESDPEEPVVETFYAIYLGTEAETINGMTLVFGLSDGTITEGSDAILLASEDDGAVITIDDLTAGTVYLVTTTDGEVTNAEEVQYISGVVYALGDEYVSLYDESQDESRPYTSFVYGDYAGVSYDANPDFDQITELSETIIPASTGDYVNVYTAPVFDEKGEATGELEVVFITVGHSCEFVESVVADDDGIAVTDTGIKIEDLEVEGGTYLVTECYDPYDINGNEYTLVSVEYYDCLYYYQVNGTYLSVDSALTVDTTAAYAFKNYVDAYAYDTNTDDTKTIVDFKACGVYLGADVDLVVSEYYVDDDGEIVAVIGAADGALVIDYGVDVEAVEVEVTSSTGTLIVNDSGAATGIKNSSGKSLVTASGFSFSDEACFVNVDGELANEGSVNYIINSDGEVIFAVYVGD